MAFILRNCSSSVSVNGNSIIHSPAVAGLNHSSKLNIQPPRPVSHAQSLTMLRFTLDHMDKPSSNFLKENIVVWKQIANKSLIFFVFQILDFLKYPAVRK